MFFLIESQIIQTLRVQIYCLSDLHSDSSSNFEWLSKNHPERDDMTYTILICSGDLTNDVIRLRETFVLLKSKYDEVYYALKCEDYLVLGVLCSRKS